MLLLGVDFVAFGIGMALLDPTTVLPSLVQLLGGSPVVVGSIGTIATGGWLLPQVLAGRYVAGRPLLKKYVVVPAYIGRTCLLLAALALLWLKGHAPGLALAILLLGYASHVVNDALSSVAWLDLLGKVVPLELRGRWTGTSQALASLLSIGAGALVTAILARPGSPVGNYALLIALAAVAFYIGSTGTALVREPRGEGHSEDDLPWRKYLPRLLGILRSDGRFAWLVIVRWLMSLADMAANFYIVYATSRLGISTGMTGIFISAKVIGSLLCGLVLGPLGDRKGSARIIAILPVLRCLSPILALLAPFVAAGNPRIILGIFALIFVNSGLINGTYMLGFTNYILEIAPPGERSLYIALANTLGGLVTVAPLFAGWLVEVASYELLFAVSLAVALVGVVLAWRGPQPFVARLAAVRPGQQG